MNFDHSKKTVLCHWSYWLRPSFSRECTISSTIPNVGKAVSYRRYRYMLHSVVSLSFQPQFTSLAVRITIHCKLWSRRRGRFPFPCIFWPQDCTHLSWIHTNNASVFPSLSRMRIFIFWPHKLKCACEKVKCACDKAIKKIACVRVYLRCFNAVPIDLTKPIYPYSLLYKTTCTCTQTWS